MNANEEVSTAAKDEESPTNTATSSGRERPKKSGSSLSSKSGYFFINPLLSSVHCTGMKE